MKYSVRISTVWTAAIVVAASLVRGPHTAAAQGARLLPVEHPASFYIERLHRRGYLLELRPTAAPYAAGDVADALRSVDPATADPVAQDWLVALSELIGVEDVEVGDEAVVGGVVEAGGTAVSGRRLDVLRPLGSAPAVYPRAAVRAFLAAGPVVAEGGLVHDLYYERDPDGLDAAHRLYLRSEHAYVGYDGRWASAYLGRFAHHWGTPSRTALVLSANPRSYDGLSLRVGSSVVSVQGVLGELDSIEGDGRFTGRAFGSGSRRRYLAAHRLDWRPARHFMLSLVEAVLYSGAASTISLKYLNPMHALTFVSDNRPKNDENNVMIGLQAWGQVGRVTLQGQVLLDDFDFINGTEPASLGFVAAVDVAGVRDWVDIGFTVDAVSARTYNTAQPEGRFMFLKRGLGAPFSDYLQLGLAADIYLYQYVDGLMLSPRLQALAKGSADYRQPFPADDRLGFILTGERRGTLRASVGLVYHPSRHLRLEADVGRNAVQGMPPTGEESAWIYAFRAHVRLGSG